MPSQVQTIMGYITNLTTFSHEEPKSRTGREIGNSHVEKDANRDED
jgi:hypothetical protein